jgi:putative ABC transport system permease protein
MFKNYIKTALRSFKKNKTITAINIIGLAVGISASIVIFLIVQYDHSFDKWEPQANNIFRLNAHGTYGDFFGAPIPAGDAIKSQITGIEKMCRYMEFPERDFIVTISSGKNEKSKIYNDEKDIIFADKNYFEIFPHQWLKGDPSFSLAQPNEVVLSLSVAQKYFPGLGLDEIVGKRILYGDSTNVLVSGIVADLKEHTDLDNKSFISYTTFASSNRWNYNNGMQNWNYPDGQFHCFLQLYKNSSVANVDGQLKRLYNSNVKETDPNFKFTAALQPLSEIHFGLNTNGELTNGKADRSVLINLTMLAIALLLLAAINFINLSTARATLRAKEIGVRKTFGSSKKQIIYQFLVEALLITIFATLLAVIIAPLIINVFNGFVPEGFDTGQIFQPVIIIFLFLLIITVTFLAGSYPAFVLAKFRPSLVLNDQTHSNGRSRGAWVREVLTVSQFVIAQVFLIIVIVVGKQVHYELNKDIGIRKDAIVSFKISFDGGNSNKKTILINELKKITQIQNLTSYDAGEPYTMGAEQISFKFSSKGKIVDKLVALKEGDSNYIKVFNIPLIAGHNIHVDTSGRYWAVLINATMAKEMGFSDPGDAVGSLLAPGGTGHALVVGVMKDFNMQTLHLPIEPLVYMGGNPMDGKISLALDPSNISSWPIALNKTEKIFHQLYPNKDFDYAFFDKSIENIYKSDIRLSTLLRWATGLAIFISCLGLLGLVSFMANRRIKEIGIRKVLGASVAQIIVLLSKNLVKLILIASVIAIPVAWYFSNNWLQDFAFKIPLSWWIFLISGVLMLIIALIILCLKTIKAATANPMKSLRTE